MEKGTAWSRLSPAAKENQIKYNQSNYSVVGAKLPRERADAFRTWCAAQGKTVSGVLSEYIYSIIGRDPDAAPTGKTRSTENQAGADAENQAENLDSSASREG